MYTRRPQSFRRNEAVKDGLATFCNACLQALVPSDPFSPVPDGSHLPGVPHLKPWSHLPGVPKIWRRPEKN